MTSKFTSKAFSQTLLTITFQWNCLWKLPNQAFSHLLTVYNHCNFQYSAPTNMATYMKLTSSHRVHYRGRVSDKPDALRRALEWKIVVSAYGWFLLRSRQRAWRRRNRWCQHGRGTSAGWKGRGTRWQCVCWGLYGTGFRNTPAGQRLEWSIGLLVRWWDGRRWDYELDEGEEKERGIWEQRDMPLDSHNAGG